MTKLIDFDQRFHQYLHRWMEQNAARYPKVEDMEAQMPQVYLDFVNQRADWLEGRSPGEYFAAINDPEQAVALLREYQRQGVPIPDLLLERLVDLGPASVPPLMALVRDQDAPEDLRAVALNLLIELGSDAPMEDCLALVDAREEEDGLADVAAELLQALGPKPVPQMLKRLPGASPSALATYLDLLCNFPGDERIYEYTMGEFLKRPAQRAMFASFLGKLGDQRAIEPLRQAMSMDDINYLDYLEIANAIEMLGGEAGNRDRDFSGDPYYESLRQL